MPLEEIPNTMCYTLLWGLYFKGKESKLHTFAAESFYHVISKAVGFDMENASDFKLLDRKAVDALTNMQERNTFFRALSISSIVIAS